MAASSQGAPPGEGRPANLKWSVRRGAPRRHRRAYVPGGAAAARPPLPLGTPVASARRGATRPRAPPPAPAPRSMEAAYEAAVVEVGGVDTAKPRGVYDAMVAAAGGDEAAATAPGGPLPALTIQGVKWKLLAHRRGGAAAAAG